MQNISRTTVEGMVREFITIGRRFDDPTAHQVDALKSFLTCDALSVHRLLRLAVAFEPIAKLRTRKDMLVRVGRQIPVAGSPHMSLWLRHLLEDAKQGQHPYLVHQRFGTLHPLTDANGRAGRGLWAWGMMRANKLDVDRLDTMSFLHIWYLHSQSPTCLQSAAEAIG